VWLAQEDLFSQCIPGGVFWGGFKWHSRNKMVTVTALLFWGP